MAAELDRRDFIKGAVAGATLVSAAPAEARKARPEAQEPREQEAATATRPHRPRAARPAQARLFLNDAEAVFLAAALDVLIPADDAGPGGVEAGVVAFIDRQLAGAWGSGARMYLRGPWADGTPQQGYQLPLTPAQLFRAGVPEVDALARKAGGQPFAQLPPERRDALLSALDKGELSLATLPGQAFLELLRTSAVEGYFADPAYGGNRNMAAWRMIGFPGARGAYVDDIESARGKRFAAEPISLADLQQQPQP